MGRRRIMLLLPKDDKSVMDKDSMPKTRQNCKLKMGLDEFVEMAFANKRVDAEIICPCKHCGDESSVAVKVATDHLKSVGSTKGYAKIIGSKATSTLLSQSQKSDDNKMNAVEETIDIKLYKDFVERSLPSGLDERKVHDFLADFLHLEHDPDKTISMLLEFTKELSQEGADLPKSLSEMLPVSDGEEDKKNQPSSSTSFGGEEEDTTALGEKRNQPSASTSSGSVGYSPKEEYRRKLREKINQRKESRSPRLR